MFPLGSCIQTSGSHLEELSEKIMETCWRKQSREVSFESLLPRLLPLHPLLFLCAGGNIISQLPDSVTVVATPFQSQLSLEQKV